MDIFEVATEFKFDVGQAIFSSKALQEAVDDVSSSATSAMASLNYLASGLVAHLGFGSGGLLSVLTKAVQISEAFNASSLDFSNNISSNIKVLSGTIDNFNDRLATSKMLMGNIANTAINSGLDTGALSRTTMMLATPLANAGRLGKNYGGAINMSKNLMLGSEAVGLHPQVATESLYRALTDKMPLHGALFARMANTQAFKAAHVTTQHQIMNMGQDKKIDLLSKALEQLAGDADWLNNRLHAINTQFTILKDEIEVLLKPIGDALVKPIRVILEGVTGYLKTHAKELGDAIGKLIGNIFDDPKKLFVNVMQLKHLGSDLKKSLHLIELVQTFAFIRWALGKLGIEFSGGLLKTGLGYLISGLRALGGWLWSIGAVGGLFRLMGAAISAFLAPLAAVLFFFQIISRARAIAQINDAANMAELLPKIAPLLIRLKTAFENIMMPITMAINYWAQLIAPLFETTAWLKILMPLMDTFTSVVEYMGKMVYAATATFSALSYAIIGFVSDIINLKNPFTSFSANFKTGFQDFMTQHPYNQDPSKAVVNQVTNVGKIEARFDMREQLEPDRIAFAVTTHLKKLAMNPTQGRGNSSSAAFGNPVIAGAR
jgi:hypothetical protein